eukprot:545568_1
MADNKSKRKIKNKSKVSLPTEDEADWTNNSSKRPGTAKSRRGRSRPGTAKSKKKVTIDDSNSGYNGTRTHSYKSSTLSVGNSTPTGSSRGGLTYRDVQESMYPPPIGQKHNIMGRKKIPSIPNINNIQSAIQRGIKHNRKIEKSRNFSGGMNEEQTREVSEADAQRLEMMNKYFADKIDEYKDMIEKCKEDARKKREKNKSEGVRKINALGPFMMSKKFYNMMEADISQVYIAYRRLSSTSSAKKMGSYDHIMYDDQIKDGLVEYKTKFVHLVCKPYQCWMNLFNIDENAAKELSEVGLLVLEHFNKVGRYKKGFPKWLIDLRGWEHSIAMQYLSKPVFIFEVIEHIKNGNYWARYHQYLREENDDVYLKKWTDGTDYFPHKSTALYWYFHESDVDHWMTIEEYNNKKKKKIYKNKKKKKN